MKRMLYSMIAIIPLLINGCGAKPTPVIDPAQVQASAVSFAATMIALTQASYSPTPAPTDTPEPSPTPAPTDTPLPPPTLQADAPTTDPGKDPCQSVLGTNLGGPKANLVLANQTNASVNVSLSLAKTKFGDCGYRSYALAKGASVNITDLPQGCYSVFAWINDPKSPAQVSGGGCWNSPLRMYIVIKDKLIKLTLGHP